jgi:hypothetical protein
MNYQVILFVVRKLTTRSIGGLKTNATTQSKSQISMRLALSFSRHRTMKLLNAADIECFELQTQMQSNAKCFELQTQMHNAGPMWAQYGPKVGPLWGQCGASMRPARDRDGPHLILEHMLVM